MLKQISGPLFALLFTTSCHSTASIHGSGSDTETESGTTTETDEDTSTETDTTPEISSLEWVPVQGSVFQMGSLESEDNPDQMPLHEVEIANFELTKSEITIEQYRKCWDSGECTEEPESSDLGNWDKPNKEKHPVNDISWLASRVFCNWVGGRLPSEAEWEFAARSGGQDIEYPWGNDIPNCDYAVMDEDSPGWGFSGCGQDGTSEVCSRPLGGTTNTDPEICDLSGNVWEWVEDNWHNDYAGAPDNGLAWNDDGSTIRVLRGGSFGIYQPDIGLPARFRDSAPEDWRNYIVGFRCARDVP